MRIAVIGDVHGNIVAFEEVLAHVRAQTPDVIVQIGDYVVGYPDSRACWELARSVGGPLLRGNHEGYLLKLGTPDGAQFDAERFAPAYWSRAQFTAAAIREIAALPLTGAVAGADDVLFMHSAPDNDHLAIHAHTPDAVIAPHFETRAERVFVRGHNHIENERQLLGKRIITIGSAGLPLDGQFDARYLLLDRAGEGWHVTHVAVPYNRRMALQRFTDSGWLRDTGVIGRLYFDEARTCTNLLNKQFFGLVQQGLPLREAYQQHMGYPPEQVVPLHNAV